MEKQRERLNSRLGFNVWSGFQLGSLTSVLDLEDYFISNVILPGGSFLTILFCTAKFGRGFDNYMAEANTGKGLKVKKWMKPYFKYVLPAIILVLGVLSAIKPFVSLPF